MGGRPTCPTMISSRSTWSGLRRSEREGLRPGRRHSSSGAASSVAPPETRCRGRAGCRAGGFHSQRLALDAVLCGGLIREKGARLRIRHRLAPLSLAGPREAASPRPRLPSPLDAESRASPPLRRPAPRPAPRSRPGGIVPLAEPAAAASEGHRARCTAAASCRRGAAGDALSPVLPSKWPAGFETANPSFTRVWQNALFCCGCTSQFIHLCGRRFRSAISRR